MTIYISIKVKNTKNIIQFSVHSVTYRITPVGGSCIFYIVIVDLFSNCVFIFWLSRSTSATLGLGGYRMVMIVSSLA